VIANGGKTFVGNSGTTYTEGKQESIGPADVRQALMLGWVQPDDAPAGVWSGENHPDMLTVTLKDFEARIAALERLIKPVAVPT
jgi:hypothetical protein